MSEVVRNRLYEHRTKKSVTQETLASALQVSRQTIIAIEKGNYTPSVALALKAATYFKRPVEELFSLAYEK